MLQQQFQEADDLLVFFVLKIRIEENKKGCENYLRACPEPANEVKLGPASSSVLVFGFVWI